MIRNSTAADSPHAFMLATPGAAKAPAFQRRVTTGGITTSTSTSGVPPVWVRLSGAGNVISAYRSADGVNWVLVGRDTFAMGATAQVGLAVTRHDNSQLASVTFDNVRTTPAPPAWSQADIGAFTMAATMNVGLAVTSHDDTQAATATFESVRVTSPVP